VSVTPQWSDQVHLASQLAPIRRVSLHLGWDFGLNCTCVISQVTPMGFWYILDAFVGESGTGVIQLVEDFVKPRLLERYPGFYWDHTGDPTGQNREASNADVSAVKTLKEQLGGPWRPGPVSLEERLLPLRGVLRKMGDSGRGIVQVDRDFAKPVWHALRGGWHFPRVHTGVVSASPKKDHHSHAGDAMAYLASRFYPQGRPRNQKVKRSVQPAIASYWSEKLGRIARIPTHGEPIRTLPARMRD
jgi:hypothetical protein